MWPTRLLRLPIEAVGLASGIAASYVGLLTVASLVPSSTPRGKVAGHRFAIVIPAHNEETGLPATLASVAAIAYPSELIRVLVVADNCTDRTADVARAHAAEVLERVDDTRRGKGYALRMAFDHLLDDDQLDGVVVIDADTLVSDNLLAELAQALASGAQAVQVDYKVRNPERSWRTRLLDVSFTCNHLIRSRGRTRLGASAGLRGNGMMFTPDLLRRVPYGAFSAVEDVEYGIDLGMAGVAVGFVDRAWVAGDMPTASEDSSSQRTRWEQGRTEVRNAKLPAVLRRLARRPDPLVADMAADLVMPPLATVLVGVAASAAAGLVVPTSALTRSAVGVGGVALLGHVTVGVLRSESKLRALPALAKVPQYVLWKLKVRLNTSPEASTPWIRTKRSYET